VYNKIFENPALKRKQKIKKNHFFDLRFQIKSYQIVVVVYNFAEMCSVPQVINCLDFKFLILSKLFYKGCPSHYPHIIEISLDYLIPQRN